MFIYGVSSKTSGGSVCVNGFVRITYVLHSFDPSKFRAMKSWQATRRHYLLLEAALPLDRSFISLLSADNLRRSVVDGYESLTKSPLSANIHKGLSKLTFSSQLLMRGIMTSRCNSAE